MNLQVVCLITLCLVAATVDGQSQQCVDGGSIRLSRTVNVNHTGAGRLEVCFNSVWGTVAADSFTTPWSEKNSQVACQELGFSGALNSILQETVVVTDRAGDAVPVHYTGVVCDGTESRLEECSLSTATSGLSHLSDVFIVCRPTATVPQASVYSNLHTPGPNAGDIRLLGSPNNGAGAVEIYTLNIGWTGICPDSSWTDDDAEAVCRALGYETGVARTYRITNGAIAARQANDAHCTGSGLVENSRILAGVCTFSLFGVCSNTDPNAYAGVECSSSSAEGSVRLFGSTPDGDRAGGMVEVLYNGRWGVVCGGVFSTVNAEVICQQLGHNRQGARAITTTDDVYAGLLVQESSLKPLWIGGIECLPSAGSLSQCPRNIVVGYTGCGVAIAAVECGGPRPLSGGPIAGIVISVLLVVGLTIWLGIHLDKKKKEGKLKGCHLRLLADIRRSCSNCCKSLRPQPRPAQRQVQSETQPPAAVVTVSEAPAVEQRQPSATPGPSAPAETSLPPEVLEARDPEFTKEPPPSYGWANDLPPPYPGHPDPSFAYPPPTN